MTTPHTNRGVTDPEKSKTHPVEVSVDWLQYSVPWPAELHSWPDEGAALADVLKACLPPHEKLALSGELLPGLRGYNGGMTASFGRLFWHSRNRQQHIGVIFTGDDMRAAISVLLPHRQMVSWALSRAKKITRLDVAVDVRDPRADPTDVLHLWKRGDVGTPARQVSEAATYVNDPVRGIVKTPTVYVGTRDSERMVRVYDKAGQLGISGTWVRVELQARDEQAMALARAIRNVGVPDAARAAIRGYCNIPKLAWYTEALTGPAVELDKVERKETNTDRWLREVALPALQKRAIEKVNDGDWTLYDALEKALGDILSYSNGGYKNAK